jgi:trk system potassium uptake protein TrkH
MVVADFRRGGTTPRSLLTTTSSTRRSMVRTVTFVLGFSVAATGVAMLVPAAVSFSIGETETAGGMLLAAGISIGLGSVAWLTAGRPREIGMKDGFAAVGLAWFALTAAGALPYLTTGTIPNLADAFFEAASGFSTTGASILADPSTLPVGVALWRGLTQFLGGMGVIVLSVAILPLLGVGGVQLARAESPGVAPERITPRFRETARRLWLLYAVLTVVLIFLLAIGDMDLLQATVHAFATVSTGGFGTEPTSVAGFSPYTKWVITLFMFLAGANFALHYKALRRPRAYTANPEFRLYLWITLGAVVIVAGGLVSEFGWDRAFADATFTVVSILTTTGFATTDFGAWRPALQVVVVALMFFGGMAGSTSGSVKTYRIGILGKAAGAELRYFLNRRRVTSVSFGGKRVPEPIVESVQSFFLFYMMIFMTGTFLLGFIDANVTEQLDLVTAASAVATSLGNVGPGLGAVGPTANFGGLADVGKWLLAGLMIVGRLEIFPVLVLFSPTLWRR